MFPVSNPNKHCPKCRETLGKATAKSKAKRKLDPVLHAHDKKVDAEYYAEHKVERAEYKAKRKADPEKRANDLKTDAKYRAEHKVERAEYNARYNAEHKVERAEYKAEYRAKNRDELNEKQKKRNRTLQCRFQKMLCKFGVNGLDGSFSTKMQKLGFVDTEDLKNFFRRQFEPGMTFDNHGRQRIDGSRMWHIGHMIVPQYAYDADLEEEQLRCFHKSNLAPQWADENLAQGTALASDEVLLQHQHLWPASWKNKLPSAQLRADIQGKRLDRASNAYDTASDDSDFDFDDSDDEAGPSGVHTMPQDSDSD